MSDRSNVAQSRSSRNTTKVSAPTSYQFPEGRHVGGFPNLSLIGRTVSIASNGHIHLFPRRRLVLVGKGEARTDGNLGADNALPPKKVVLLVVKVHATALALGVPIHGPKQFTNHLGDGASANECDAVTAVARNPRVFLVKGPVDAGSDRFLPIVQVAKAANVAGLVFVVLCFVCDDKHI